MTENIENEKIIIDFNKMDKIGNKNVSEINKKITNIRKERKKLAEIISKEIIDYILKKGNITLENEEEITKRNSELIKYVVKSDHAFYDKEKIEKYKKIMDIRNNGKTDYCIKTDKQMVKNYNEIMDIRNKFYEMMFECVNTNIDFITMNQMKDWIKALIDINGIERMLKIHEKNDYKYDYLLDWQKGITHENSNYWFFRRIITGLFGVY